MVQHLHICQALRLGRCHTVLYCLFPADSVGSNFTGWEPVDRTYARSHTIKINSVFVLLALTILTNFLFQYF